MTCMTLTVPAEDLADTINDLSREGLWHLSVQGRPVYEPQALPNTRVAANHGNGQVSVAIQTPTTVELLWVQPGTTVTVTSDLR